jgi:hypothetical protein
MEWQFYFATHNLDCNIKERSLKPRQKDSHQCDIGHDDGPYEAETCKKLEKYI